MSPGQRTMIENNLGVIRKVVLKFVHHWAAISDSWQYAVACQAVCEAVNKWNPKRGKFSTFATNVAYNAIVLEWNTRQRKSLPLVDIEGRDFEIPCNAKLTFDLPYEELFKNGFSPELRRDVEMFRRSVEGESVTDIVKEIGISRQTFYNRIAAVKKELFKHVVIMSDD